MKIKLILIVLILLTNMAMSGNEIKLQDDFCKRSDLKGGIGLSLRIKRCLKTSVSYPNIKEHDENLQKVVQSISKEIETKSRTKSP